MNCTEANFLSVTKDSQDNRAKKSPSTEQHTHATGPLDATSVHSHPSSTSGGTTITQEDDDLLFTSMTKTLTIAVQVTK